MAKLSDIFQKASNLLSNYIDDNPVAGGISLGNLGHHGILGRSHPSGNSRRSTRHSASEGEIIFSKNNICIHAPSTCSQAGPTHFPGYFTIKVHKFLPFCEDGDDLHEESTLILNWVPNNVIEQHPKSITPDSSPVKSIRKINSPEVVTAEELASDMRTLNMSRSGSTNFPGDDSIEAANNNLNISGSRRGSSSTALASNPLSSHSINSMSSQNTSLAKSSYNNSLPKGSVPGQTISLSSRSRIGTQISPQVSATAHSINHSATQECHESKTRSMSLTVEDNEPSEQVCNQVVSESPFKEETANRPTIEPISLDLRQMKSLRLFFTSSEEASSTQESSDNSTGQLVIAGRDGRFQVFHFHRAGLDKLVSVLEEWQFLKKKQKKLRNNARRGSTASTSSVTSTSSTPPAGVRNFSVWRPPTLKQDECHIEEGIYSELDEETLYRRIMNSSGQIDDPFKFRRIVFFGGVSPIIRREVWPFLLKRFHYNSTFDERTNLMLRGRKQYEELDSRRMSMSSEEADCFWKKIQSTVEKDAPRTDRTNPFFAGDSNENVLIMKRILLNYAYHNPSIGYTQGMSDLLAPLLIEMRDESEAFWSFEGLMERTFFISSPKDSDMDSNLSLLRELLRVMNPRFFMHLASLPDGLELLFTHRWLLLCFKREFPESAALKIWESAWSRYQTDYFHLFVCLSVIGIYGNEVIDQDMKADEILFHFSTMTLHMNGDLVLKKARGLLYQFLSLPRIPCTLKKLLLSTMNDNSEDESVPPSPSTLLPNFPSIECVQRFRSPASFYGQSNNMANSCVSTTTFPLDVCQCSLSSTNDTEANLFV